MPPGGPQISLSGWGSLGLCPIVALPWQEEVATAWKVLRTEPIVLRLRFSLSQYLDGPGEWGRAGRGVPLCPQDGHSGGTEGFSSFSPCRTIHRGFPAVQQGGLRAGSAAEEVRAKTWWPPKGGGGGGPCHHRFAPETARCHMSPCHPLLSAAQPCDGLTAGFGWGREGAGQPRPPTHQA